MLKRFVITTAAVFVFTSAALATQCPSIIGDIDAALETAQLSEADAARVNELRTRGEELHQAGNHDESIAVLTEAQEILGIDE